MSEIKVNGVAIDGQVRYINGQTSLKQARELVDHEKDGYDTIIGQLNGQDVLIRTRVDRQLHMFDQVTVGCEKVTVHHVENEENVLGEGGRVSLAIAPGVIGFIASAVGIGVSGVASKVPGLLRIPAVAAGLVLGTGAAVKAGQLVDQWTLPTPNDAMTDSITTADCPR